MKDATDSKKEESSGETEDFAALFEGQASAYAVSGSRHVIVARVIAKEADYYLVDIGLKSEARLGVAEVPVDLKVAMGATLPVIRVKSESGGDGPLVSLRGAVRRLQTAALQKCLQESVRLDAQIYRRRGDGFFAGLFIPQAFDGITEAKMLPENLWRAFPYPAEITMAEIDIHPPTQPKKWLGRRVQVKVLELRRDGPALVSRKKVVQEMREVLRQETLVNIKEGDVASARVKEVAVESVGLEINGVAALMSQTESSWYPKPNLARRFRVGDTIEVKVIKKDAEGQRLHVSRRAMEANPADDLVKKFSKGLVVEGEVSKILPNGSCFVRLPSIKREAFIPAGELLKELEMKEGAKVKAQVLRVDKENVRVVLSIRRYEEAQMPDIVARYTAGSMPLRLGDILNAAVQEAEGDDARDQDENEPS